MNDTDSLNVINDINIVSGEGSITVLAYENLSTSTVSGITSFKSGDKLNMKSAAAMLINPETTLTETVGTSKTSTTGSTWGHTSGGDITVTGGPNINLNP